MTGTTNLDGTEETSTTTEASLDEIMNANNKKRMIEINTYYSKQYNAYTQIFKYIFIACIPLLILGMLEKEEIISDVVYFRLSLLVIVIAFLVVIERVNDLFWRYNLVFDNYEWLYDDGSNTSVYEYNKKNFNLKRGLNVVGKDLVSGANVIGCTGVNCCGEGTTWNQDKKKCLQSSSVTTTADSTTTTADSTTTDSTTTQ